MELYSQNFRITGEPTDPSFLNYDIRSLHKERTIIKGELVRVDYFKDVDPATKEYSNLILSERRIYHRDGIGIIIYREMYTDYYFEDGTVGLTKTHNNKYYSEDEAIREGQNRRKNMMSFAKIKLLAMLKIWYGEPTNQYYAFDLLNSVLTEIKVFEEGNPGPLKAAIQNSTKAYMTAEIKAEVITELTY